MNDMSKSIDAFDMLCADLDLADMLLMAIEEANLLVITTPEVPEMRRVAAGSELLSMARARLQAARDNVSRISFRAEPAK